MDYKGVVVLVITIDGLGVNGKTTMARRISQKYNIKNFNTGAIYRTITLAIVKNNWDVKNIDEVLTKLENLNIEFLNERVLLNGEDVTDIIRTEFISVRSTKLATIPELKQYVRNYQKEYIKHNDTVMEGRDIATRIAPDADLKFYLYSDFLTRVERLHKDNQEMNLEEVYKSLKLRDEIDLNGKNFVKPEKAIEIDTTNKTVDEVFSIMQKYINEYLNRQNRLKY